jgi:hypothetical protein
MKYNQRFKRKKKKLTKGDISDLIVVSRHDFGVKKMRVEAKISAFQLPFYSKIFFFFFWFENFSSPSSNHFEGSVRKAVPGSAQLASY